MQVQRGAIKPKEIGYDVFTISLDTLHLISRNLLVLPLFPILGRKDNNNLKTDILCELGNIHCIVTDAIATVFV